IHRNRCRLIEGITIGCDNGGNNVVGVDLADQIVALVNDVEVPLRVGGDAGGKVKEGACARTVVRARLAQHARDGRGADDAIGADKTNGMVALIDDHKPAAGRHDPQGVVKLRQRADAAVGAGTAPSQQGERAGAGNKFEDLIVGGVGDVSVLAGVSRLLFGSNRPLETTVETNCAWAPDARSNSAATPRRIRFPARNLNTL